MHHSFYLEQEDAILEALSAWNLDNPYAEGEVFFLGLGFGWDPRTGRPDPRDQEIFRA